MNARFLELGAVSLLIEKDVVALALTLVPETVTEVDDDKVFALDEATTKDGLVIGVFDLERNLIECVVASDLRDVREVTLLRKYYVE